jgi:hypothetical protein
MKYYIKTYTNLLTEKHCEIRRGILDGHNKLDQAVNEWLASNGDKKLFEKWDHNALKWLVNEIGSSLKMTDTIWWNNVNAIDLFIIGMTVKEDIKLGLLIRHEMEEVKFGDVADDAEKVPSHKWHFSGNDKLFTLE